MLRVVQIVLPFVAYCVILCTSGMAIGETMQIANQLSVADLDKQIGVLDAERERIGNLLMNSLSSSDDSQVKFAAAYLLGRYRFEQAVNTLSDFLTTEDISAVTRVTKSRSRWGQYPAVEALIRIGKPSIPAMLRNLEMSKDEHVRGLSARVIFYIEGPELSKLVVENAIKTQDEPEKKKRLESAMPLVKGGEYQKPQQAK